MVQGSAFNYPTPDHVRIVYLPTVKQLNKACEEFEDFLKHYKQNKSTDRFKAGTANKNHPHSEWFFISVCPTFLCGGGKFTGLYSEGGI